MHEKPSAPKHIPKSGADEAEFRSLHNSNFRHQVQRREPMYRNPRLSRSLCLWGGLSSYAHDPEREEGVGQKGLSAAVLLI